MSFDRSIARCSFCGRRLPEVRRLIAGPGAAYICDECLELCNDILRDPTPFSAKALELASRPPVVIAAPPELSQARASNETSDPRRVINIELEQRQPGGTLLLQQLRLFAQHFELHYVWIREPFPPGFAFVPRIIFILRDSTGNQWMGDKGGMLFERGDLSDGPDSAIYQGYARFRPLFSEDARHLFVRAADPLSQFEQAASHPWEFEITL